MPRSGGQRGEVPLPLLTPVVLFLLQVTESAPHQSPEAPRAALAPQTPQEPCDTRRCRLCASRYADTRERQRPWPSGSSSVIAALSGTNYH